MDEQANRQAINIAWLKEHPRQHEFFAATSEVELGELAANLTARGQQEPIHCCADGTIVRGHRRVQAAKMLGWDTIDANVCNDLGDPLSEQAIAELLTDNLMRRQLDDLALARCYRALKGAATAARDGDRGDARDLLAARLNSGKSGRTLDRLERLLDLPRDVQDMISRGTLTKSNGEKILQLPTKKRESLFVSLRTGQPPRDVLQCHGIIKTVLPKTPDELGKELLVFFHSHVEQLARHVDDLDRMQVHGGEALDVLDRAIGFLNAWRDRKRNLRRQSVDSIQSLIPSAGRTK